MKISRFYKIATIAVAAIIAAAATSCTRCSDSDHIADQAIKEPVDSLFGSMFSKKDPGAVVCVVRNGHVAYLRGFGKATMDSEMPMTDTTALNACSITKMFVTAAVYKLAEDGKLTLDEPLSDFFPTFPKEVFSRISLKHILSHTTGLPDKRPRNAEQWKNYIKRHDSTFSISDDYMLFGREPEMIKFFETVDHLEAEPGTQYQYQEPPFMLLSHVIEQASGMSFNKFMTDSIFTPAGLTDTYFFVPEKDRPNQAHAYAAPESFPEEGEFKTQDGRWEEYDYGEAAFFPTQADRGLFTTARDFIKWQNAFYGGEILHPDTVAKIVEWHVDTKIPHIGYGHGAFVERNPNYPPKTFHMSYNGGFSVYEAAFPAEHVYYFVLSNRPDWDRLAVGTKMDAILRKAGWI